MACITNNGMETLSIRPEGVTDPVWLPMGMSPRADISEYCKRIMRRVKMIQHPMGSSFAYIVIQISKPIVHHHGRFIDFGNMIGPHHVLHLLDRQPLLRPLTPFPNNKRLSQFLCEDRLPQSLSSRKVRLVPHIQAPRDRDSNIQGAIGTRSRHIIWQYNTAHGISDACQHLVTDESSS